MNQLIRLEPRNVYALNRRGYAWAAKREFDKATRDFERAIQIDKNDADAHVGRGQLWYWRKEVERAIREYDLAIRLDPQSAIAYAARGIAQLCQERVREGPRRLRTRDIHQPRIGHGLHWPRTRPARDQGT